MGCTGTVDALTLRCHAPACLELFIGGFHYAVYSWCRSKTEIRPISCKSDESCLARFRGGLWLDLSVAEMQPYQFLEGSISSQHLDSVARYQGTVQTRVREVENQRGLSSLPPWKRRRVQCYSPNQNAHIPCE